MTHSDVSTSDRHRAREAAQACLGVDGVETADVVEEPGGAYAVELVIADNRVPPAVMRRLAVRDLGIVPDRTATRGDPTHTIALAR